MRYMDGKFDVCCRMLALVDPRDRAPVVQCRAKRCRHSLPRQNPSGNARQRRVKDWASSAALGKAS